MTDLFSGAPPSVRLGKVAVFAGRAVEQVVIVAVSLLLAARLGPASFAPVGVLLVVSTMAVTLADQGLALRALRMEPAQRIELSHLRRVRSANSAILVGLVAIAATVQGDLRLVVGGAGLVWLTGAEATIRKAAALRAGAARRTAWAEVMGAAALATCCGLGWLDPPNALAWVVVGLTAKHLVEAAVAGPWRWAFGSGGPEADRVGVWLSQVLAYGIANVDYLIVGLVLGEEAIAVYLLAFRLANAVPSQVSFAVARIATVDLASGERSLLQRRYERYTSALFIAGLVGASVTVLLSPLAEVLLGDEWAGSSWALAVLVLAAPWRTVLGTAGTLSIVSGAADRLVRWEVVRLIVTAVALCGAALLGFGWLVATVTLLAIGTTVIYHHLASSVAKITPWRPLRWAGAVSVVVSSVVVVAGWSSLDRLS